MERELRGCSILITGASRGIGRCLAEKLAPLGVKLTLAARGESALIELADKLGVAGALVFAVPADVSVASEREALVSAAVEKDGRAGRAGKQRWRRQFRTFRVIVRSRAAYHHGGEFLRPGRDDATGRTAAKEPGRNARRLAVEMAASSKPVFSAVRGPHDGTEGAATLQLSRGIAGCAGLPG